MRQRNFRRAAKRLDDPDRGTPRDRDEGRIELTEDLIECDVERVRDRVLSGGFRVDDN